MNKMVKRRIWSVSYFWYDYLRKKSLSANTKVSRHIDSHVADCGAPSKLQIFKKMMNAFFSLVNIFCTCSYETRQCSSSKAADLQYKRTKYQKNIKHT